MTTPPSPDDLSAPDATLDALFADARSQRTDTSRAEYGFETRLLARLADERAERDGWSEFFTWCWRLVPAFAVVTLAVGLWTMRPEAASPVVGSVFSAAQPLPSDDEDRLAQWLAVEWLTPI